MLSIGRWGVVLSGLWFKVSVKVFAREFRELGPAIQGAWSQGFHIHDL